MVTLRCTGKLLKRLGATPQTALITGATDAGCAALHPEFARASEPGYGPAQSPAAMTNPASRCQVVGVQVGTVQPLQVGHDLWEMSGIRKHAVAGRVAVRALGLQGDEQADLNVHGGLSKAVYAYPLEHYEFWRAEQRAVGLSGDLPYGSLAAGESFEVHRGPRETPLMTLFMAGRSRAR